ncbi:hypothetical protein NUU61_002716 [Penicillium alfredii]|uniref:DUF455 domain protein n=1 Tax=Penicillium alfredii TaxID=1506179 RepID=A0A9W9FS21_9EURO|nr:uncharacterized protein NUU61_002716 [Penicillium alfredii]KAJ5105369.1 hypothetical protein NUU61_002716 [Penicillium alfredii]
MQGFNMGRYVPPDQEGLTSANKLAGKHALGARARHLHTTGALIVRFEMPFAVWCTTCKPHETLIGQGVRFNAEKKKVGNYYSTPVYSFRMKHTACGGWIEIRTDPQNTAYVVFEGGRKRDTGETKELQPGEIAIRPYGMGEQGPAEKDAFSKLEGKVVDKRRAETETTRILELQKRQNRDWDDPYEKSRRLRRAFRTERKGLEKADANREALKDKMSLGIDLVDETEEDRQRAGLVDFGDDQTAAGEQAARTTRVRPMFEQRTQTAIPDSRSRDKHKSSSRVHRTEGLIARRKASLRHELAGNTRAAVDPFLADVADEQNAWQPEIKRRKTDSPLITGSARDLKNLTANTTATDSSTGNTSVLNSPDVGLADGTKGSSTAATPTALVDYTSDTD